jgi:hypothetical protein
MLQQFTNLSSAFPLAITKNPVVHRLTLSSLRLGAVRMLLWPLLTFPPNLPRKITKVHISPWVFKRTFPVQSLQKQAALSNEDTPGTEAGAHANVQQPPGSNEGGLGRQGLRSAQARQ